MKNATLVVCMATAALTGSYLLVGCDKVVSNTKTRSVSNDGTVKSKEETVTRAQDGTVTTTTEETKKTTSTDQP